MTKKSGWTHRRTTASIMAVLLTSLSVAVPLLDGGEFFRAPVLETEHSSSTCVIGHDHTICTQFGANLGLTADLPGHRTPHATVSDASGHHARELSEAPLDANRLPRAPPTA